VADFIFGHPPISRPALCGCQPPCVDIQIIGIPSKILERRPPLPAGPLACLEALLKAGLKWTAFETRRIAAQEHEKLNTASRNQRK
jgi:hypothetical protein